jgi:lipopolysaccharide transport system permease protein
VPLSAVIANFVSFAIQFGTFVLYFLLFRASHIESTVGPNASALLLPGVLLQLGALGLGVGLWLAALTAKFRDFAVLSGFLLQLWMYVTPLIYPLSKVPSQWRHFVALNPVAVPVESFRYMLLGTGSITPSLYAISLGMTLVALVSGLVVFQRVEKTFIDTV